MSLRRVVWIAGVVAFPFVAGGWPAAHATDGQALAAMRIALQRESSARQAYLAYAAKADDERCAPVGALFRALAAAEGVHADNLTRALEQMDVTPTIVAESLAVGTTAANLRVAIDAEEFERRVAYPKFMGYASEECLYDARATFRYARDAARSHVLRLALALARLEEAAPAGAGPVADNSRDEAGATYFVCLGCGRVSASPLARHCDCGTAAKKCAVFQATEPVQAPALVAARP